MILNIILGWLLINTWLTLIIVLAEGGAYIDKGELFTLFICAVFSFPLCLCVVRLKNKICEKRMQKKYTDKYGNIPNRDDALDWNEIPQGGESEGKE